MINPFLPDDLPRIDVAYRTKGPVNRRYFPITLRSENRDYTWKKSLTEECRNYRWFVGQLSGASMYASATYYYDTRYYYNRQQQLPTANNHNNYNNNHNNYNNNHRLQRHDNDTNDATTIRQPTSYQPGGHIDGTASGAASWSRTIEVGATRGRTSVEMKRLAWLESLRRDGSKIMKSSSRFPRTAFSNWTTRRKKVKCVVGPSQPHL